MDQHLLSIVLFTPLAALVVLLFLPASNKNLILIWANVSALAGFLVSIPLVTRFDRSLAGFQMTERADWIPSLGVKYFVGIDGIFSFSPTNHDGLGNEGCAMLMIENGKWTVLKK